jgi:hypothetical protein
MAGFAGNTDYPGILKNPKHLPATIISLPDFRASEFSHKLCGSKDLMILLSHFVIFQQAVVISAGE